MPSALHNVTTASSRLPTHSKYQTFFITGIKSMYTAAILFSNFTQIKWSK